MKQNLTIENVSIEQDLPSHVDPVEQDFQRIKSSIHQQLVEAFDLSSLRNVDDDELWHASDDEYYELSTKELRETGLIGDARILASHVIRIKRCYPVYDRGYKTHLKPIEEYLNTIEGLSVIGRYGAFKYNNQDHSILMGILAAERIAQNIDHSLWEINTDYENYQEAALITETGLTKV